MFFAVDIYIYTHTLMKNKIKLLEYVSIYSKLNLLVIYLDFSCQNIKVIYIKTPNTYATRILTFAEKKNQIEFLLHNNFIDA